MNRESADSQFDPELRIRIEKVADRFRTRREAAAAAGVSPDQLQRYIRGENVPSVAIAAKLAQAAKVSMVWLAYGAGAMEAGIAEDQAPYGAGDAAPEGFVLVPRYDVRVSAGPGAIVGDENVRDWLAFRADFLRRELGADPSHVFSFDAVGDSMEPTIKHGDTLTFVRIAGALPSDGIFALGIGDALVVKRVQPVLGGLMLLSDNPAYKPETLSIEEAKEVRALGRLKVISRVV